jgi:hypothetical protein
VYFIIFIGRNMTDSSLSAKATVRVLELAQMIGSKEEDEKEIEFFFYANELNDALDLMNHLKGLQYDVQCVPPETIQDRWFITGITKKLRMKEHVIINWTEAMETIAYCYNSIFDGWGMIVGD